MSAYTRKKKKEKQRLREQDEARSHLHAIITSGSCRGILDWNPRQLLSYVRLCRSLPAARSDTMEYLIELVQKEDEFTYDNVASKMEAIATSPRIVKSLPKDEFGQTYNSVLDHFKWRKPNELLEFTQFCRMDSSREYIKAMISITAWSQNHWGKTPVESLRYEDINQIMDIARVHVVMES